MYQNSGTVANDLRTVWQKRSLIFTLAFTDLRLRYSNSSLGFVWSLLEPLLMLAVLYVIFTYVRDRPIENFPIFLFLGIIMWGTFVKGTSTGMNSLTAKRGIIGRMPLPLEIPVMSALVTSLLLMMIEFVALFLFMVAYQFLPPSTIALLPALIVLESILILGVSFPLAALGALYKDVRHAWTILIYAAFFVTGIFYDINHLPDELRQLIYYNPMADVVALSRTLAMGNPLSADFPWAYMIGIPFLALFAGYAVFRRYHDRIVEEM